MMREFKLIITDMRQYFRDQIRRGVALRDLDQPDIPCLVMLDQSLPEDEKILTLKHELSHIILGHVDSLCKDQAEYDRREAEADEYADHLTDEELQSIRDQYEIA